MVEIFVWLVFGQCSGTSFYCPGPQCILVTPFKLPGLLLALLHQVEVTVVEAFLFQWFGKDRYEKKTINRNGRCIACQIVGLSAAAGLC